MKKHLLGLITISLVVMFLFSGFTTVVKAEDDGKITTDDGILVIQSDDGRFKYQLDARLYLDAAIMFDDEEVIDLHSGSEIRRMRFAIKATLWNDWLAEIDFDFAGNEVDIKDAWIGYKAVDNMLFKIGNFRSPFSLEEVTSSRYVTFIERGLPNAFPTGRLLGLGVYRWGTNWQAAAGIFGQEPGDIDEAEGEDSDEGHALVGRFSVAPINSNNNVIHLGASYAYKTTDAFTEKMRFRGYDETKISKIRFLSTGKVKDVDNVAMMGLEGVVQFGPLHIQGEYITADVTRIAGEGQPDYSLSGGYVFGSFFLTGDSMVYNAYEGEFGRMIPKKKFGAIELLARYSFLDLNDLDNDIEGGEGKNITLGMNWYLNANLKLMVNYTIVDHDKYADADGDWDVPEEGYDYDVLAMRLLVTF